MDAQGHLDQLIALIGDNTQWARGPVLTCNACRRRHCWPDEWAHPDCYALLRAGQLETLRGRRKNWSAGRRRRYEERRRLRLGRRGSRVSVAAQLAPAGAGG